MFPKPDRSRQGDRSDRPFSILNRIDVPETDQVLWARSWLRGRSGTNRRLLDHCSARERLAPGRFLSVGAADFAKQFLSWEGHGLRRVTERFCPSERSSRWGENGLLCRGTIGAGASGGRAKPPAPRVCETGAQITS